MFNTNNLNYKTQYHISKITKIRVNLCETYNLVAEKQKRFLKIICDIHRYETCIDVENLKHEGTLYYFSSA